MSSDREPGRPGAATIDALVVRAAIDSAPDGVVITDEGGVIRFANRAAETLFGYSPGELDGEHIEVLVLEEARALHRTLHLEYTERPVSRPMGLGIDLRGRHRDGSAVEVEISLSPVAVERPYVIAIVRDVAERKRAREELDLARSRLAIADDRERIARDLHDTVIQRLFATGLGLESAVGRPDLDQRVEDAVIAIDAAIKDLRTSIFSLRRPTALLGTADALRVTAEEARRILDGSLRVDVATELDRAVPPGLRDELIAVVREALTNVAKHAAASTVELSVGLLDGKVVIRVVDDGAGFDPLLPKAGQGLRSLEDRARQRGGTCQVHSAAGSGTQVVWAVPLDA